MLTAELAKARAETVLKDTLDYHPEGATHAAWWSVWLQAEQQLQARKAASFMGGAILQMADLMERMAGPDITDDEVRHLDKMRADAHTILEMITP